jgi:hypothetical protein
MSGNGTRHLEANVNRRRSDALRPGCHDIGRRQLVPLRNKTRHPYPLPSLRTFPLKNYLAACASPSLALLVRTGAEEGKGFPWSGEAPYSKVRCHPEMFCLLYKDRYRG